MEKEIKKETEQKMTKQFECVFLGADWSAGVSKKTNKAYAFGTARFDFEATKKDGSPYIQHLEIFIEKEADMPSSSIEKYKPVLVEFAMPDSPADKLKFVRIVKNI